MLKEKVNKIDKPKVKESVLSPQINPDNLPQAIKRNRKPF